MPPMLIINLEKTNKCVKLKIFQGESWQGGGGGGWFGRVGRGAQFCINCEISIFLTFSKVQPWLSTVANQLPFHALAVHSEQLDKIREEEVRFNQLFFLKTKTFVEHRLILQARLEQENTNPITFEWLVKIYFMKSSSPKSFSRQVRNNILNCQTKLSPYDRRWFGKFCYK